MFILRSVFVIDKSPGTNDVGACDVDGFDEGTMVGDELGVVVGNSDGESLGFVVVMNWSWECRSAKPTA
jgi:hypothetical protein